MHGDMGPEGRPQEAAGHRLPSTSEVDLSAGIERTLNHLGGVGLVPAEIRLEADAQPADPPRPAVHPALSIAPDFLICLEDGAPFRNLAHHLLLTYKMKPDDYRRRWGLPPDYPMKPVRAAEQRQDLIRRLSSPVQGAPAAAMAAGLQAQILRARSLGLRDGEIVELLLTGAATMASHLDVVESIHPAESGSPTARGMPGRPIQG
jgi:predicted transcriptional regulator